MRERCSDVNFKSIRANSLRNSADTIGLPDRDTTLQWDIERIHIIKRYSVENTGKLPEQEALHIFVKLLRGYLGIRNKGFIHRDIKSSNVMFRNGEPLIIDFGYCEKVASKKPKMFYNVGSPSYMSPEAYFKTFYS